jgi:hypothetical protein
MTSETEILDLLTDMPDVRVQEVGTLWQIRIGNHAGAREDGLSLARDLKALYLAERRAMDEPEPVEIPDFLQIPEPEEAEEAEVEEVEEAEAEEAFEAEPELAAEEAEPEPELADAVEEPEPELAEAVEEAEPQEEDPGVVPEGLLDLVREDEAYGDTQTRLWSLYLELNGKLMLGLATEEDAKLHTRLHGHLDWISKGAAEVVTV